MEDLRRIRTGFVGKVGLPALKGLLDDLWQHKVLSTDDKDTVLEDQTNRADRARYLIDMEPFGWILRRLKHRIKFPNRAKGRTSELLLSSEQFKTEKLKDKRQPNRTRMALLITNVHFDKENDRDGAEKDEAGYEQTADLTGIQRGRTQETSVERRWTRPSKGSHFRRPSLRRSPDQFPIDNIYKHLDSARCPKLLNKPKVIIIQACRGVDDGSAIVCDGPGSVPEQAPVVQVDAALPPHLADEVDADIEEDAIHMVHKEKDMVSLCPAPPVLKRFEDEPSLSR
ncbi:unnamed protein product [Gadus morhua 'NCC']